MPDSHFPVQMVNAVEFLHSLGKLRAQCSTSLLSLALPCYLVGVFAVGVDMVLNNAPVRLSSNTKPTARYSTNLALSGPSAGPHPCPWSVRVFSLGLLYLLSLGSFLWCELVACLAVC